MKKYSLVGVNGNAFAVMGYVTQAMKECGFPKTEQNTYMEKAMSKDYDNLLMVSMEYIEQCNQRLDS